LVKTIFPGAIFFKTPSGSGYQISLFGLAGLMTAKEGGLEFNLLGLTFGFDFKEPAVKFPHCGTNREV
jgi:hypothetical protein